MFNFNQYVINSDGQLSRLYITSRVTGVKYIGSSKTHVRRTLQNREREKESGSDRCMLIYHFMRRLVIGQLRSSKMTAALCLVYIVTKLTTFAI